MIIIITETYLEYNEMIEETENYFSFKIDTQQSLHSFKLNFTHKFIPALMFHLPF